MNGEGIFCENFLSSRGSWTACQKVWCGPCYMPLDNREFPVAKALDEGGIKTECTEDRDQYMKGRNGDNLVTPFQFDCVILEI
jgi:hypothetical protein